MSQYVLCYFSTSRLSCQPYPSIKHNTMQVEGLMECTHSLSLNTGLDLQKLLTMRLRSADGTTVSALQFQSTVLCSAHQQRPQMGCVFIQAYHRGLWHQGMLSNKHLACLPATLHGATGTVSSVSSVSVSSCFCCVMCMTYEVSLRQGFAPASSTACHKPIML